MRVRPPSSSTSVSSNRGVLRGVPQAAREDAAEVEMRVKHSLALAVALLPCHWAVGQALPPRSSPGDYPVHQDSPSAAIAAVRLKPDQVGKMFSSDVEKNYVVVEVAVYPNNGALVDVRLLDFALRFDGEQETLPDTPEDASL